MDVLKSKRQALKGSITRIYNTCSNQDISIDAIRVRVAKLDEIYIQYESVQDKIDALTIDEDELRVEDIYRGDIEEKYFAIKELFTSRSRDEDNNRTVVDNNSEGNMGQVLEAISQTQNSFTSLIDRLANDRNLHSSPILQQSGHAQEPRLPTINIPDFDGSYSEWIRFRDLFEALIHNRTSLSNVEKLEYLQTKLSGEALILIKHLRPTNDNYPIAWDLLKRKFDESDQVRLSYFRLLFDQPSVKSVNLGEVKRFYNNVNESINALRVLEEPVSHWDSILLFHLERKLDSETNQLWCRQKSGERRISFSKFLKFLEDRIFELECIDAQAVRTTNRNRGQSGAYVASVQDCFCCGRQHPIYQCEKFKEFEVPQRIQLVYDNKLCLNCLQPSHFVNDCKGSSCKICKLRHNTLLHRVKNVETERPQDNDGIRQQILTSQYSSSSGHYPNRKANFVTLLPTAIVMIRDGYGELRPCRALLDSGAQATLISEACVQGLRLRRTYDRTMLFGVGPDNRNYTKGKVEIEIISANHSVKLGTQAYILSRLTQDIPSYDVDREMVEYFQNLELADKTFYKSSKIDIIMGADIFSQCILTGRITHPTGSPIAMNTIFGWVMMGSLEHKPSHDLFAGHVSLNMDELLRKFWEVEEVPKSVKIFSDEEAEAELHYQQNVSRLENGRYMVRLPLKENIKIGESKSSATKRLVSMERRFMQRPELGNEYKRFMDEFIGLGHMEEHITEACEYFLPHHAVLKPESSTTKLRVVFDGSCKTNTGYSLNDKLLTGPTIQNDIFTIILNFRKYRIGICSDIEKMYRQVLIHPDDRKYQCVLWRDCSERTINEYHLNTVTYGTSAAPFLAIRTLHQIAIDNAHLPEIADAIDENFYVDDFMTSSDNLSSAITLKENLTTVLSQAGFKLRKWSSNSRDDDDDADDDGKDLVINPTIVNTY
ncbi:uncharacterized protein LOC124421041 [Lucilia cuprina]|uniref:uncharacterized protein LOC124421041 n=1 Tax=Lucilia cuprina TaxID=7375 RepID=UPI001F056148|nr:uncharacterized protein LOC124421041 [Lucilia cuprina]